MFTTDIGGNFTVPSYIGRSLSLRHLQTENLCGWNEWKCDMAMATYIRRHRSHTGQLQAMSAQLLIVSLTVSLTSC